MNAMDAFGMPRGLLGRLGGRIMARSGEPAQRELLPLIDARPGQRVLEVGYGPGRLVELLLAVPDVVVTGVDPSQTMRDMARRRIRSSGGRVDLRLGTADATGLPDGSFDRVVTVNNLQIWPDTAAGLRELRRVTAPGGRLVVAVHSRTSVSRFARRFGLDERQLAAEATTLNSMFGEVVRHRLDYTDAFVATAPR